MAFLLLLGGCDRRESKARDAFASYQAALATGDLKAAQTSLQQLVAADDSQAQYWLELGRVNLQLSDFGAAFAAFSRAHELDRANPETLSVLTQVALRSGNLQMAEQYARELELVSPGHPAIRLTYGYVALRRGDFAAADRQAKEILATSPYDSGAKILQARTLLGLGETAEAVAVLEEQLRLQPSDQQSLRALLSIYEFKDRWQEAAATARSLLKFQPAEQQLRARLIDAELRVGRASAAIPDTIGGLKDAGAADIELLLAPWLMSGARQAIAQPVFAIAQEASGDRRLAFARYLSIIGLPDQVARLTAPMATLPVKADNVAANALYGAALAQAGRSAEGLARLEQVLLLDNGNADALRARAELKSRAGRHDEAIEDAQKVVALDSNLPFNRLLLANIYSAAGNSNGARRTLWDAFHDLPADRSVYDALRVVLVKTDGPAAVQRLAKEYEDQRIAKMTRSFS